MMRDLVTKLLRGPSSLAIAGMVVNGANLIANLTLARMLAPHSYGAVVELTNIFMILSMIGSSLQVAVVQRDTAIEEQGRTVTRAWIRRLRGKCIAGVVVATLAGLALAEPVCALLSFPHRFAFAEVVAAAALWSAISIERGLLQSRAAYPTLARNLSYEGAIRVVGTIVLVGVGAGVDGASTALILGLLVGIEHARRASALTVRPPRSGRRRAPSAAALAAAGRRPAPRLSPDGDLLVETGPLTIPAPRGVNTSRALMYGTAVAMGALIPLSALQNIDVVIVGRANPHEVGAWAAIATACKVPVFLGLAVANFLLPEAARRHHEGESATNALLTALAWVTTPGLLLVGVALVDPRWLLTTVFGAQLAGGASALWLLALAMTFLATTLLFTNYLLGVGERRIVPIVVLGVIVTAGALELAGGNLETTAVVSLVCESVLALAAGGMVLLAHPAARNRIRVITGGRSGGRAPEPAFPNAAPTGYDQHDLYPAGSAPRTGR